MMFTKLENEYQTYPAFSGNDVIRENNLPLKKTRKSWQVYANRKARELSKRDGIEWTGIVAFIPWRHAYRISFAGMKKVTV